MIITPCTGVTSLAAKQVGPGVRFSKVPIINGPVELLLFSCKIEV